VQKDTQTYAIKNITSTTLHLWVEDKSNEMRKNLTAGIDIWQ